MSIFEDTNPRALKDLLGEIHSRTTVLPDFQRDFMIQEPLPPAGSRFSVPQEEIDSAFADLVSGNESGMRWQSGE